MVVVSAKGVAWFVLHCGTNDDAMVMLGSGNPVYEDWMRATEAAYRDKFRGWVRFNVPISHRITAGCDILLMPSTFEPCGLNQLYAMRYGTIPAVHQTGGLRDTVQNFNPFVEVKNDEGTGWTFSPLTKENMLVEFSMGCKMVESVKFIPSMARIYEGSEPIQFHAIMQTFIIYKGGLSDGYKNHIAEKGIPDETYKEDGVALFVTRHNGVTFSIGIYRIDLTFFQATKLKNIPIYKEEKHNIQVKRL